MFLSRVDQIAQDSIQSGLSNPCRTVAVLAQFNGLTKLRPRALDACRSLTHHMPASNSNSILDRWVFEAIGDADIEQCLQVFATVYPVI